MLAFAAPASAATFDDLLTGGATGNCSTKDAADGETTADTKLPFLLCDDGYPSPGVGGAKKNETGDNAIEVPSAYAGFAGLPGKDESPSVPGEDTEHNVALDVDISLPDPSAFSATPAGDQYPVVVFMHGCCTGQRTDWEADTVDGPGKEKWHYNNAWFASRGYVVVTYTARGFVKGNKTPVEADDQGSTGQTQLDHRSFEINDYQHLVGQLVDQGDLHPDGARTVKVDPHGVVTTGGSYGGGFSWLTMTDPEWKSPGAGTDITLAATAPKYGWSDLAYSLVPNGTHSETELQAFDGSDTSSPLGFPKRSIVAGLYESGKLGLPPEFNHTTFSSEIDTSFLCLQSPQPFSEIPQCAGLESEILPSFIANRSAYYQNAFFEGLEDGSLNPVAVFSSGTLTDPLFPGREHRRIAERLRSVIADYPIKEYYGDYQHFVQNKQKEWSDLCGEDDHVCTYSEYPGGDLSAAPNGLSRRGVNSRLNDFLDHYVEPPANTGEPQPALDVTASLQICPENASDEFPVDQPGPRFTESRFEQLAPNILRVHRIASQTTRSEAVPNTHGLQADPVANFLATRPPSPNGPEARCPVHTSPAGPGVATYDSPELDRSFTMIGPTRVTVPYELASGNGEELQLNARLYDVFPDGKQVMIDRGFRALSSTEGTAVFYLLGNGWRLPEGHTVRVELAQDDDPYIKQSTFPSSLELAGVTLEIPVREASAAIGDVDDDDGPGDGDGDGDGDGSGDGGSGGAGAGGNAFLDPGTGGAGDVAATLDDGGDLPFTGLELALLLAAGALLLAGGLAVRRRLAHRHGTGPSGS